MSKMKYYKQAEIMYLQDNLSVNEICKNLNVSRRTIFYWKDKYEWNRKKTDKHAREEALSKKLKDFTQKLMQKLCADIDNKKSLNQSDFYSLRNILKYIPEIKQYENQIKESIKQKPTGQLSPELLRKIEQEFLGLEYDNALS